MPHADQPIVSGDMATVARRYAKTLFELAGEQKQLDAVAEDLRGLKMLERESPEFHAIAHNPRLSRTQLIKAAQQIALAAKLNPLTGNFLALLAQSRRLPQLGATIDAFLNELAAQRGEFSAEITAAEPLTQAQQEQLAAQLQKLTGGKVHMRVSEDKSLLGGFVVKLGSRMIDLSVKSKLARLERQLKSPSNILEGAV